MRIGITGVPGTGKSTLAKRISEKYIIPIVDITKLINEKKLWTSIDPADDAKIVNLIALKRELQTIPENCILESHLVCEIELPLDKIIVLRTPIKTLENRLKGRGYDDNKIKSNVYSELLDYCTMKALRRYNGKRTEIYEVLTNGQIEESMGHIDKILLDDGRHLKAPWVDIYNCNDDKL